MTSLAKRVRPTLRAEVQHLIGAMASRRASRHCLNLLYAALPQRQTARLHALCHALFADGRPLIDEGSWTVNFVGKRLLLPLTTERAWQEWDAAVATLGHDLEVKVTYANLLRSSRRPRMFFDVGANYGLHSLLFLAHGVPTISFEPNPACHGYLQRVSQLNHLNCNIQAVALSDEEGCAELWFPERDTWMGTTDTAVRDSLAHEFPLRSIKVEQTTMDTFVAKHGIHPDFIKIDTEGNEALVLRGSRETLRSFRPLVIFESWPAARNAVMATIEEAGYRIGLLPSREGSPVSVVDGRTFREHPGRNFIAFAAEQLRNGDCLL